LQYDLLDDRALRVLFQNYQFSFISSQMVCPITDETVELYPASNKNKGKANAFSAFSKKVK
jgi:hypothetical protein